MTALRLPAKRFLYVRYKCVKAGADSSKIIVSLKVSKKAVLRNRIKRRIRAILRGAKLRPDREIVIITNSNILPASFAEIKHCLLAELRRLQLVT